MAGQLLTPREKDIVALLLKDYSNVGIAKNLKMSKGTVSVRLCHIYIKFGISKLPKPRQLLKERIRQNLKQGSICRFGETKQ